MSEARGFIGAGEVYLNRVVSGVPLGLAGPYHADKFEIKTNLKKLPLISRARATYGQALEDVSVQEAPTFSLDLSEVNKESMGTALFGSSTTISQTSGTLTAEVITAKLDRWIPLTKASLTGTQTVTNSAATVTYTLGVDYEVNDLMGWVRALSGGAITEAQSLKVTTTYGAFSTTRIAGAAETEIRAQIIFVGINLVDYKPCIVTVPEALMGSDAVFDFLAESFNSVPLTGSMRTPTGASAPFTVDLRSA